MTGFRRPSGADSVSNGADGGAVGGLPLRPKAPRTPTLQDVAGLAGVSASTVSRVLANNYPVSAATRLRVKRAVRELDFVVNSHARALAGAVTKTVAFVLQDVRGRSFADAATGGEREAATRGMACLIAVTGGDPEQELAVVRLMREQRASAVVLIGGILDTAEYRDRMSAMARSLDDVGSRLVFCGRPSIGADLPITVVEYDNEGGAYAMASHLLGHGHRRILRIGGRPGLSTSEGRLRGFSRALSDHGITLDAELSVEDEYSFEAGYRRTRDVLAARPDVTAVFAETDVTAGGALAAAADLGLRVPDELSIVGFDDIDMAAQLRPSLTTVHVPYDELGRTAVRLALDYREGRSLPSDQHVVLGTHIVVRQSVARPNDDRARGTVR